ncbi:MAG: trans-2-enoyl-CoA reductase family protein [Provencibacterium sp.]|nr:trans-2-enoyl-CoA reductase family protein [Provencibacterium sp.]
MIIEPKIRGFICTTAHPEGCFENIRRQADYAKAHPVKGARKALIIGASAGYGLASRICAAFGCGADTLGVIFDKPASGGRTASAGWYNTAAFERLAAKEGLYAATINGDAFSREVKEQALERIRRDMGKVDLVLYSLAAPRRTLPDGTVCSSVLKTVGEAYTNRTIDLKRRELAEVSISPASEQEIADTVRVMGGEDWGDWIKALAEAGVLAENAITAAYSYIGPEMTHPIYMEGSIGRAKEDLYQTSRRIGESFPHLRAYISVNKALVTQSSSAIPIVPLYISILYRVMKQMGLHEGCIEQMSRLFNERLYAPNLLLDERGCIRLDDWEMRPDVQAKVNEIWERIDNENLEQLADIDGYWEDFYQMFGFHIPGVDYEKEADPAVSIPSIG